MAGGTGARAELDIMMHLQLLFRYERCYDL